MKRFQRQLRTGVLPLVAGIGLLSAHMAEAAGFERLSTASGIQAGVWYPTEAPAPSEPNTPFRQALALGADLSGEDLPLVIISHGDGGWMGGHAHTALALADAGYVAVALEHPGNNSEDESATPDQWMTTRPADITTVLDHMLSEWRFAASLDPERIGIYGFSAGGYTALVAAGARPDLAKLSAHCVDVPAEFVCRIGMLDGLEVDTVQTSLRAIPIEQRIKAVSVAAPGFAFLFEGETLSALDLPVQVWSGALDDRVPHETNGAVISEALSGRAETHIEARAGHFAFMAECNPRLQEINPRIWQMVCVDAEGFDRAAFHQELNKKIVAFFEASMP